LGKFNGKSFLRGLSRFWGALSNERDKAIAQGLEKFNKCVTEENKSKNINSNGRIKRFLPKSFDHKLLSRIL
jgi:hypothetical protein